MRIHTKSKIEGAFEGWTGYGTYRLVNGQCWEQTQYRYKYKYRYRPEAKIWRDGGRYLLEVDGMDEKIPVRRVTCPDD